MDGPEPFRESFGDQPPLDEEQVAIFAMALAGERGEKGEEGYSEHILKVGRTTAMLGRSIGLDEERIEGLRRAAMLHDVGKVTISDSVLLKPGPLDPDEWDAIEEHVIAGARLLEGSSSPVVNLAALICLTHHERWDGSGYPFGLSGEEIPQSGRMVAIADVYDALTRRRPYKEAWSPADAAAEIRAQSGRHFDPELVEAFGDLDPEVLSGPVTDEERAFLEGVRRMLGEADQPGEAER